MKEREMLSKRVQMFDFILDELNLYLDTHPYCKEAMEYYEKYEYLRNEAINQYEMNFGPLRAEDFIGDKDFNWVKGPWPWEKEAQ